MTDPSSDLRTITMNEAVELTKKVPNPAERRDLLARWRAMAMGQAMWHWSMATGTLDEAIAYHKNLGDDLLIVDTATKYVPPKPEKEEEAYKAPPLAMPGLPRKQFDPRLVQTLQLVAIFLVVTAVLSPIWFDKTFVVLYLGAAAGAVSIAALFATILNRKETA